MQLKNLMPYNGSDGFEIDSLKKEGSLVGESIYSSLLIDYHLEIRIWSNGSNPLYPPEKKMRVLISQFTDTCDVRLGSKDPDAIIMVLQVYETLLAIRLVEAMVGESNNLKLFLMISIKDMRSGAVNTPVWDIFGIEIAAVK